MGSVPRLRVSGVDERSRVRFTPESPRRRHSVARKACRPLLGLGRHERFVAQRRGSGPAPLCFARPASRGTPQEPASRGGPTHHADKKTPKKKHRDGFRVRLQVGQQCRQFRVHFVFVFVAIVLIAGVVVVSAVEVGEQCGEFVIHVVVARVVIVVIAGV